ncbi:unnamed protein product [Cuscuta epithymum]|uniref:Uncharacterized protein n=1 Tax=Cuscuta epithymum TaxID=186058 RepID=A0AAV0FDT9_9ASTE|nr:unnamed protein product [Cuscuta epithymum]
MTKSERVHGSGCQLLATVYYSVTVLVFVLVACIELSDAATLDDVYHLVEYDLSGIPYGSRLASLNHRASSSLLSSTSGHGSIVDLSQSVIMLPLRELNLTLIKGFTKILKQKSSNISWPDQNKHVEFLFC